MISLPRRCISITVPRLTTSRQQLNADAVEFDGLTMEMMAQGAKDSTGEVSGKPIFKDDGSTAPARCATTSRTSEAKSMR
jgi:hypothetical protein